MIYTSWYSNLPEKKNMQNRKHEDGCPAMVNRYSELDRESTATYCPMCGAVLSSSED
jgi:hypothetical protein